jgi:uncharacterized protein
MNPFRYSEPVPPSELIDRDHEARMLLDTAASGNNSRLVAPRRFGKTSLLRRVIEELRSEGWNAVYVDFFGVLNMADVAIRIERAYDEQLQGRFASWFAGVRRRLKPAVQIGGTPDLPVSVEVALDPQAEEPVLDRLALPRRIFDRDGTRTLIVFDEFQDVLTTKQRADAVIRSEIQHHGDAASYIFAGSQLGMMRKLFADKRRAFFGQARSVDLTPLEPEDVAGYVASRFETTGKAIGETIGPLLDTARGHPQRTMLLAHTIWELTPAQGTASEETWQSALDSVMHGVRDELRAVWLGLNTSQRRVLRAIANNREGLYARGTGRTRGGAVKSALDGLRDLGEVAEDGRTRTGYRLVDPLMELWVNSGTPTA